MLTLPPARVPRQRPEIVYLRFGRWSRRSKNHLTNRLEKGISVYAATLDHGNVVSLVDAGEVAPQVAGRLVFPVTGERAGTGSDGEPVLRRVRALPYAVDVTVGTLVRVKESS